VRHQPDDTNAERGRNQEGPIALAVALGPLQRLHFHPEVALVRCHFSKSTRKALIGIAQAGWRPAHEILCRMADVLTSFGDPLPGWLQKYVVRAAMDRKAQLLKKRRGCDPATHLVRNIVIAQVTDMIAQSCDLRPTRNVTATAGECACSIVAKALASLDLHMSEANVARIWREDLNERDVIQRITLRKLQRKLAGQVRSLRIEAIYSEELAEILAELEADLAHAVNTPLDRSQVTRHSHA
jgi:hypothetical protein